MLADITFDNAMPHAPLIIFVHGFKGFKDWGTHYLLAHSFAERGYRFLKFNFSHNGTTPEHPDDFVDLIAFSENTFTIELADLQYVIDFAASGAAIPIAKEVILLGHSMGGGISIVTAAEDDRVKALITMASVGSFRNLWPKDFEPQWRLMGLFYAENKRTGQQMPVKATLLDDLDANATRLNIVARAAEVKQPWLIAHGTADPTVAVSHAQDLKNAQPDAELLIMPDVDHVFGGTHPYLSNELPSPLHHLCEAAVTFLGKNSLNVF